MCRLDVVCLAEMEKYAAGGWVTGIKYEDELRDILKERTAGKDDEVRLFVLHAPNDQRWLYAREAVQWKTQAKLGLNPEIGIDFSIGSQPLLKLRCRDSKFQGSRGRPLCMIQGCR